MAHPDSFYAAVVARDPRFDGVFFVGVTTTGIYCRPVCVARTPGRDRCRFFRTAAEAERAGFRACFRCRPEIAPGHSSIDAVSRLVVAALKRVDDGFLNQNRVAALASELGVTDRHLRRAVETEVGVSLVEIAQSRRLALARRLVIDSRLPLIEIAQASGFGSVRRFNALFAARFKRAPSWFRRTRKPPAGARARGRRGRQMSWATAAKMARRASNAAPAGTVAHGGAVVDQAITLRLDFRPPYRWSSLLDFLALRAIPGVEVVTDGEYRRVVRIGDDTGTVRVRTHPRADGRAPSLRAEISPSLIGHLMPVTKRLRAVFDLDARPDLIAAHLGRDPLLAAGVRRAPGLRLPGAFDGFEVAARAVLGQQISVRAATTLAGRLVARFGTSFAAASPLGLAHAFPTARAVAAAPIEDLAAIGLPAARAATLRDVAALFDAPEFLRVLQGGLPTSRAPESDVPHVCAQGTPRDGDDDSHADVARRLTAIRGIGDWTAAYITMRAMHNPDAFPADDLGVRRALGGLSARAARARAEAWRPWRSYAVMYLWTSLNEEQES